MEDDKTRILGPDEASTRILTGEPAQPPRELPEPRVEGGRITFQCSAGHKLVVPENLAGKRGKCSKCGVPLQIPEFAPAEPLVPEPTLKFGPPDADESPMLPSEAISTVPPSADGPAADTGGAEAAAEPEWNFISGIDQPARAAANAGAAFTESAWPAGPIGGDEGNPMALLLHRLWAEREHGGIVEIHLTGGSVILPEEFAARWSGGSHGLFASQAADGTVTLTAVAWETVQRIVVRHLSAVPGDMFE